MRSLLLGLLPSPKQTNKQTNKQTHSLARPSLPPLTQAPTHPPSFPFLIRPTFPSFSLSLLSLPPSLFLPPSLPPLLPPSLSSPSPSSPLDENKRSHTYPSLPS